MEGKASSPKREFKQLRSRNQKILRSNLLEAINREAAAAGCVVSRINEDGVVRMKIVVRKQDLKQMLGIINGGKKINNNNNNIKAENNNYNYQYSSVLSPILSVEERLNLLKRKHLRRSTNAMKKNMISRHPWSPDLQSIPEEY